MVGKYKVVTLCGSTRFKEQFMDAQKRLTLAGYIVISVGLFGHAGDQEVFNVGGYIGDSTRSEIQYAEEHGKPVRYYQNIRK